MTRLACIQTFGCQMNQLDSELLRGLLEEAGYGATVDENEADLIVYNTCSVRQNAENRVFGRLGSLKPLKNRKPGLVIALVGCMAQNHRGEIFHTAPHVDVVCGTREFPSFLEMLERVDHGEGKQLAVDPSASLGDVYSHRRLRRGSHHAYVSVMRGCDNFCSYCIVPYVRGREESRSVGEIVDEVKRLRHGGVIEVTLLGQNVSSYGKNLDGANLAGLLRRVSEIDGIERIWFVTGHPADMTTEVFEAMRDCPNVMEYLHMPAQSGASAVLERMNRRYTREHYMELVHEAHEIVPSLGVASDFIVGFPGETEADFRQTASMVEECRFSCAFIFKYSPRPGTKAADLEDDVPMDVKKARNRELLAVQERIATEENAKFVGQTLQVLVQGLSKSNKTRLSGRSRSHRIVIIEELAASPGTIVPVKITRSTALSLYGRLEKRHGTGS